MGSLEILVQNATNVPNVETFGKSDPYTTVEFYGQKQKTEMMKGELNPQWNQTLIFDLGGTALKSTDELKIYVKDWEMVGRNRLLGQATYPLKEIVRGAKTQKLSLSLVDGNNRPTTCTLNLTVTYKLPPGAQDAMTEPGSVVHVGGDTANKGPQAKPEQESSQAHPNNADTSTVIRPEVREDEDDSEEDEDEEFEEGDTVDGKPRKKRKKKKKRRYGNRKLRGKLSSKPQDFQIRIKVIEARQLPGANISPVSRVTCYNQTKQTRVQKSTNSPFWNEVFFFNFFASPAELFDELITFGVYNSRKLRSDAFIGSFKCDIGMIYDEANHSLLNKWLLLSDPEDTMAGAKGYLKICATVLGPGDDAPSFKPQAQDEDEDIESNLLRPAGVQLRPATFKLKLYRAEDIPRMDSDFMQGVKKVFGTEEKKELVDPYFLFSFAGKDVKSKIMYNNDHPEFNQELRLGLRFPSMCERIKFMMFDWDRISEDDPIGTAFINISHVSAPGDSDKGEDGFLPTFGPCYMNFYGSPREYSDLPDEYEDLNLGKGEGVAYRGRVLLELQTCMGEMPETESEDLLYEDILRVQKFQRRRKYKLHVAFMNATMVSAIDAPVEFEVSIGNYGNKLDETVPPCSSTTQPTNAVFDGCYYYFLPWGNNKPCVVVDSHWEDISFRLEALNFIMNVTEKLESNVEKVKVGLKANLPTPELAQLMIASLDQLVADCSKPLPLPIDGQHIQNDLDRQLRIYREGELDHIVKEAKKLRENATDVEEALHEIEGYLASLQNLCTEPQNSMPDVVLWMISGGKRIAYFRAPAHLVLWSSNPEYRGKFCGKLETISLLYPGNKAEKENKWEIPALCRVKVWLGLEKHESEWHKMQKEGELAVFAETYENQVSILGNWTNKGPTMTRPKFSDPTGKVGLNKEDFTPPPGWRWDGDWYVSPELSMLYDKDAGHTMFLEDVYECQSRIPGGTWAPATVPWTDVKGDGALGKDELELPAGWEWQEDWTADLNRAVDEEGWEYTVEATLGGYGPVEKNYHMCRRRRWVRMRKLVKTVKQQEEEDQLKQKFSEGWEYAPLFTMKFHHKERKMDLVRRRRWHRKMVADDPKAPCFFKMPTEPAPTAPLGGMMGGLKKAPVDGEAITKAALTAPRMFLTCNKAHKYQLRAYLYQARDLLAGDSNGLSDNHIGALSDPFARIAFLNKSYVTEKLDKTLCPTWDQTLIFEQVEIHGQPDSIAVKPPEIVIEIFDHDTFGSAEFLGRTTAYPMVKLDAADMRQPVLQWYPIMKGPQYGGELLAAFELFLINGKDLPFLPPKRGNLYLVPNGIRPVMQRTAIEVMCWGVRNMKKFQLASVTSPSVEFEVGGHIIQSKVIKNTNKNPNFEESLLFFDIMLPKEELYTPPLNVRVRDNRPFGRKPMVGVHVIKSLEEFRCEPILPEEDQELELPNVIGNGQAQDVVIDMPSEKSPMKWAKLASKGIGKIKKKKKKKDKDKDKDKDEKEEKQEGEKEKGTEKKDKEKDIEKQELPDIELPQHKGKGKVKVKQLKSKLKHGLRRDDHPDLWEEDIDWWSKYYASIGELDKCKMYLELGYDKIQVFNMELEKVGNYDDFRDFCHTFELTRGKSIEEEESSIVGEFKGTFRVYPLPGDPNALMPKKILDNLPPSHPEECVVRVYIIKANDLQPNDPSGLADPYIQIRLGKKKKDNRDEYQPNTLSPVFGKMFELKATLPMDKDLIIRVKDYDLIGTDDVIGETVVDLENRFLTKYRATCGLPLTYCVTGPNIWRDCQKPKQILEDFCQKHAITGPIFSGNNSVKVGNRVFSLSDFEQTKTKHSHLGPSEERLALHILHAMPPSLQLPLCPEHVETRPLFNPLQPGIAQGNLQMWIDIFPSSLGPPGPPLDITPRKPKKYELRIIIWNTKDVILEEESITGEKMSDIYVKGWVSGIDEKQETDVHYRSLDGEGNFNWRFVFPFEYLPAEDSLIVKKKEHFWSLDETELRLPPILMIQIWDNDKFSADDFLGTLELNLNNMPGPTKKSTSCTLKQLPDISLGTSSNVKMVSLFEQKRLRGFWPCYNDESGTRELTGKVEMEMELVPEAEAEEKPAGCGRDEPNQHPVLEPPKRPETSFLWFTSPWKTFKHIIWKNYKWYFIGGIILLLLVVFIILFIYAVPGASVGAIFG